MRRVQILPSKHKHILTALTRCYTPIIRPPVFASSAAPSRCLSSTRPTFRRIQPRPIIAMSSSSSSSLNVERLMDVAKVQVADLVLSVLPVAFPEVANVEELRNEVVNKMAKIAKGVTGQGDLALPCFVFGKKVTHGKTADHTRTTRDHRQPYDALHPPHCFFLFSSTLFLLVFRSRVLLRRLLRLWVPPFRVASPLSRMIRLWL